MDIIPNLDSVKVPENEGFNNGAKFDNVVNKSIPFKDNAFVEIDGDVNVPVNVGLAILDFKFNAVCCAVETGLLVSLVLLTFDKPTLLWDKFDTVVFEKFIEDPEEKVTAPCKFKEFWKAWLPKKVCVDEPEFINAYKFWSSRSDNKPLIQFALIDPMGNDILPDAVKLFVVTFVVVILPETLKSVATPELLLLFFA